MKTHSKTNAGRILDGLGISYEIREYEVSLEEFSALEATEEKIMYAAVH